MLGVFPGNERARKLYEHHGYDLELMRMAQGPLLRDAFKGGNRTELTARARRVRSLVDEARGER